MKMKYADQLRHPNWQKKRLEVLSAAGFSCSNCGDKETMLHVHHKHYVKGRMAWEYDAAELEALCAPCHDAAHEVKERVARFFAAIPFEMHPDILGLVAGYLSRSQILDPGRAEELRQDNADVYLAGVVAMESAYRLDVLAKIAGELAATSPSVADELDAWRDFRGAED